MHFLCKCGYRFHDSSDCLSYKGGIIADQDWNEFWDCIEELGKSHKNDHAIYEQIDHLFRVNLYQCPSCGRVFIEDPENRSQFIRFTPCLEGEPEPDVNKRLLISSYGKKWKGHLYANWYDEKPEWCAHRGMIYPMVNIQLDNLSFDDHEVFEKRFYELFEHLKGLKLISYAILNVNHKRKFMWGENDDK